MYRLSKGYLIILICGKTDKKPHNYLLEIPTKVGEYHYYGMRHWGNPISHTTSLYLLKMSVSMLVPPVVETSLNWKTWKPSPSAGVEKWHPYRWSLYLAWSTKGQKGRNSSPEVHKSIYTQKGEHDHFSLRAFQFELVQKQEGLRGPFSKCSRTMRRGF